MPTAYAMFLHGGNFLKRETGRVYHEGEFCRIDLMELITFYGNDEKHEENQVAGSVSLRYATSWGHSSLLQVFED